MLVTDAFVYLHQPKTGGTFAAEMLAAVHEARGVPMTIVAVEIGQEHLLQPVAPGHAVRLMLGARYQHGCRRDIPPAYRHLPVVTAIRNPYDRYISQFLFAWWRVLPEMFGPLEQIRRTYPAYPELTFEDFVRLTNTASVRRATDGSEASAGFHTQQFIEFFFRDPEQAWACLGDDDALRVMWSEQVRRLRLLDQARLNEELADVLVEYGYAEDEVAFIRAAGLVRPAQKETEVAGWTCRYSKRIGGYVGVREDMPDVAETRAQYFTPELKAFVRQKERLLFEQFPQFDRQGAVRSDRRRQVVRRDAASR